MPPSAARSTAGSILSSAPAEPPPNLTVFASASVSCPLIVLAAKGSAVREYRIIDPGSRIESDKWIAALELCKIAAQEPGCCVRMAAMIFLAVRTDKVLNPAYAGVRHCERFKSAS